MAPLEAALLVAILLAPLHWLVTRELDRMDDPAYLRSQGVVVVKPEIVDPAEPIGWYSSQPIWATVMFKGMTYRFDRIVPAAKADGVGAGELFLPPGLIYRLE
jgi:hypothetical protein